MNKIILIVITILLRYELANGQTVVTLEDCFKKLEENHPLVKQKPLVELSQKWQLKNTSIQNLPQISANGQATWQSDVTRVPINIPNINIQSPPQDQYRTTLDITQNLWDGGLANSQKEQIIASSKVEIDKIATDIFQAKTQVVNSFFGILLQERLLENLNVLNMDLKSRKEKIGELQKNGLVSKSAVLSLEAKILELDQQIFETQEKKSSFQNTLSILTGQNLQNATKYEFSPTMVENSSFKNNRPEVSLFDSQIELLNTGKKLIKTKNQPKVTLFGTGGYGRPGLNMLANSFDTYFIGGLNLKVPLTYLYSGSQKSELENLNISQSKLGIQKENFDNNVNIQYQNQLSEIRKLTQVLKTDDELIKTKENIRKIADAQFQNGIISFTELLTEITSENAAVQNKILHEVFLQLANYNLKSIVGNL
jgi:outer membrane protein TolC